MTTMTMKHRTDVVGAMGERYDEILTPEALAFVAALDSEFAGRRCELLARRRTRRAELEAGHELDFLPETRHIREDATWRVAPPAPGLVDRRVEITGPTERKMTVNALNSGARVWMADFEDANTPDLGERGRRPAQPAGRHRPHDRLHRGRGQGVPARRASCRRSWCGRAAGTCCEKHIAHRRPAGLGVAGRLRAVPLPLRAAPARRAAAGRTSTCRSSRATSRRGCGTTSSSSRRTTLGIPRGTIRATVLIETITAAFEMDEILYELREHSAGLNAGPLGLHLQHHQELPRRGADYVLPDRGRRSR